MININEELLSAVYFGLGRTDEDLIYFDKLKGDVLGYNSGYFSSYMGDQSIQNRIFANRIMNREPHDKIDEKRYILIDKLLLTDYLNEFKSQSNGREPYIDFVDYFSVEILKNFSHHKNFTISDLYKTENIEFKFHESFEKKYQNRVLELSDEYNIIYQKTLKALALNWIQKNYI